MAHPKDIIDERDCSNCQYEETQYETRRARRGLAASSESFRASRSAKNL